MMIILKKNLNVFSPLFHFNLECLVRSPVSDAKYKAHQSTIMGERDDSRKKETLHPRWYLREIDSKIPTPHPFP